MTISKENRDFIDSLVDYYINESESYKQIAENFVPEIESVPDTAFGIITGCVYSGFLQAYQNQQQTPGLDDMREFNQIIKERAALIKKSILDPPKPETATKEEKYEPENQSSDNNFQ
ncbi:MAG TPA: hypothetical protein VIS47_01320 [Nitrosopumilus sp.]